MKRKGQMTLEIVIMLLLVINIFAFISTPLKDVSLAATESIGVSGLAVNAVDSIANAVNIVGISGDGARLELQVAMHEDFEDFSCGDSINLSFQVADEVGVYDSDAFGVSAEIERGDESYARPVDFEVIGCPSAAGEGKDCLLFENVQGAVKISSC